MGTGDSVAVRRPAATRLMAARPRAVCAWLAEHGEPVTGSVDIRRIGIGQSNATNDHQWIHVDPERAAGGPFGDTIAHGLLTLSLLPQFMHELYHVDNVAMAINYGFNKVRFITPVRVGAKVRARSEIAKVTKLEGAVQAVLVTTVEVEGSEKPAAVIESIVRYVG